MNSVFYYSILQYRYAQSLGEVLNVGVLLLFPEQRQAVFIHPERLGRIRKLYPKFAEKTIRSYFKGIAARTSQLSKQPEIFANYEEHPRQLIDNEILIRDSSALQFGELKTAVLYTDDLSAISNQFYKLYLSFYDEDGYRTHHDESYLLKEYQKRLRRRLNSSLLRDAFTNPLTIKPEGSSFTYKFPFAWQNGTYNLVKPVSFDLKLESSIHEKATLNFGQFTLLTPYADAHNARFDVLVARPKDRGLYKPYDQAVQLLTDLPHVKIVEEEQLDSYSEKTVEALR
ncbi:hypothetical protein GCM10028803_47810 [Larkinella knui]|uniref:DUF3037 domain-containing protein n=1 Tax=Larkinella knui TaxID=2025310 RepID=UPI00163ABFF5|nr:DUF3037 domain-containing protein [Larkinella knui]